MISVKESTSNAAFLAPPDPKERWNLAWENHVWKGATLTMTLSPVQMEWYAASKYTHQLWSTHLSKIRWMLENQRRQQKQSVKAAQQDNNNSNDRSAEEELLKQLNINEYLENKK